MMKHYLRVLIVLFFLPFTIQSSYSNGFSNSENSNDAFTSSYDTLCTPNPSPEARAVFNYIQDLKGKKTLSGQMWAPWGIDELDYLKEVTGKEPALRGMDFIDEIENENEVQHAIDWWKKGGIPTIMWHWGAPAVGDGYENSKKKIDINQCFIEGTPEFNSMWSELKIKADHLEKLRDANIPILWRPFHELNGAWFWWGMQGPDLFEKLWQTMYNYFVNERKLNNLIWVLCYTGEPNGDWNPGKEYFDIAGADTYSDKGTQIKMYNKVKEIIGSETSPIAYHECGIPPAPTACWEEGATWSWWMIWHTTWLSKIDKDYLKQVFDHELVITLDEVPDIMATYGDK